MVSNRTITEDDWENAPGKELTVGTQAPKSCGVDLGGIGAPWSSVESVNWAYPSDGVYVVRFADDKVVFVWAWADESIGAALGRDPKRCPRSITHVAGPLVIEVQEES